MKANITFIGINFFPEDSAIGLYTTQMAEYLMYSYNISVITGFPYYPEWEIRDEYKTKPKYIIEKKNEITIYRYKQYVPKEPTFIKRILHLLDYTFGSIRNIYKIKKCDLVVCIVPFTTTVALGLLLAKLRGAKVWIHIQDFEFDAALESGLAGELSRMKVKLFSGLFWLEKKLLDKADIVSTISYGMLKKMEMKTARPSYFFPNWVDEDFINPIKAQRHDLMCSNKLKILYSGNIGAKQDWDFFLRVVEHYQNHENMEFIIVGAGAKKEWLVQQTREIRNVKHFMPVKYETLPDLLCSADLHILFQKNDVIDTVMPSKLLGMMASSKPSLVTGNLESEVAKVFNESNGGYFFDSCAFEEVVKTIDSILNDRIISKNMGIKAREYIIKYFSATEVLKSFHSQIEKVLDNKKNQLR